MGPGTRVYWIALGIMLSLVLPIAGSAAIAFLFTNTPFQNVPLHCLLEISGGLMAISIAAILVIERRRNKEARHYTAMASAFGVMGVLDLIHASLAVGNNFVWLNGAATFLGGLLFACVWIGDRQLSPRQARLIPLALAIAAGVSGIASCIWESSLPAMLSDDGFTVPARLMNFAGGIGFVIAGMFFIRRFHIGFHIEDWLFAVQTMLFGAAGFVFKFSELWNPAWWWWHSLQVCAYLAALILCRAHVRGGGGRIAACQSKIAQSES